MTFLFSTTMTIILVTIILFLIGAILYLNVQFYQEKKAFEIKLYALQNSIVEISRKQSGQLDQIKLSEELEKSLKSTRAVLSGDISGLNYDLFEILSKNNLI